MYDSNTHTEIYIYACNVSIILQSRHSTYTPLYVLAWYSKLKRARWGWAVRAESENQETAVGLLLSSACSSRCEMLQWVGDLCTTPPILGITPADMLYNYLFLKCQLTLSGFCAILWASRRGALIYPLYWTSKPIVRGLGWEEQVLCYWRCIWSSSCIYPCGF